MVDPHLGVALNPLRAEKVRLEAWVRYESETWARATIERGLPMSELPRSTAYCRELGERITALLEANLKFPDDRKALPAGTAGT